MNTSMKPVYLSLNIGDQLTSISCGHIVVEIIKFIIYQKQQIPYSYQWLKQVVNKRKLFEDEDLKESFQSERHYRAASTALGNLDFILKSLQQEISSPYMPEEVCIALGGTPVTCKEMYRLLLPAGCHKPQCHSSYIANDHKIQRNVFRELVTSERLNQVLFTQLPPTNLFVFLKKKILDGHEDNILNSDNFVHTNGCRVPKNTKIVVIDFRTSLENMGCCNEFQIFGDFINYKLEDLKINDADDVNEFNEIESTDTVKWYQSSYVMKGFKDCFVNGSSVTNSWVNL